VGVIVGARGESVKGFIVLGTCEKRVIVSVKKNYKNRVYLYPNLLNQLELYLNKISILEN
jgi:hypothetical protein